MKNWQIGIASATGPEQVSWQNDYVDAATFEEAEKLAMGKGYYRNLRLREC